MENAIIVSYDPFAMESRVSILKDNNQEQVNVCSAIDELANTLVQLTYKHNIYSVKIHAPSSTTNEIKREIEQNEQNIYSHNKIKVGVI